MEKADVAVIGLGQMGAGIARNLAMAGLLGGVFDVSPEAVQRAGLPESVICQPVADLVTRCQTHVFAVQSTQQVADAIEGGVLPPGHMIIDVTTSSPDESRKLARALSEQGSGYVDAAMTGGAAGADAGALTLMVGGEPDHVAHCQPVFDAIAERTFHLGPAGAGHAMKLVHNMILHSQFLATCEGLTLAARAGLDLAQAVDVLNAGNARSFVTDTRFPRDILSGTMQARSTISNLSKDLGLAVEFGAKLDAPCPYAQLTSAMLTVASDVDGAETDFSWLFPGFAAYAAEFETGR